MYKYIKPLFFKALSGIHAGTGSDLGLVDLPIQRERHSGLPKIESSSVKGCIREEFEQLDGLPNDFVTIVFGPDDGDKHAGSIAFTDVRLLLFPVRSAKGVFAYATCPYIINRLAEDFSLAGINVRKFEDCEKAQVSSDKLIILQTGKVVLEEFTIDAKQTSYAKELGESIVAWLKLEDYQADLVRNNLIILSNDYFKDFAQNNTEIITRIKINNETGTVAERALFTEELLPAETVLYSLVMVSKILLEKEQREKSETAIIAGADDGKYLLNMIAEKMPHYIQLGGDATIGKGLCRMTWGV